MKMKHILLPLIAITLCGCSKTDKLYKRGAYESPYFYSNYYLKEDTRDFQIAKEIEETPMELHSHDGLKYLHAEDVGGLQWEYAEKEKLWSYNNNLALVDEGFKQGAISKLYDGRVRCEGLYQKSRAQLDKVGFAAKLPLTMKHCDYFAFSCRGGTTLENPLMKEIYFNFTICFYTQSAGGMYDKHIYRLNDVLVNTDFQSRTNLVSFYIDQTNVDNKFRLENTVAYEIRWECIDPTLALYNLTDDRTDKEKDHLALMLYEVFFGNSTWVK